MAIEWPLRRLSNVKVKHRHMKAYRGVKLQLPIFLTSTLDEDEQ
jgi:hypothetical protein